MPDDVYSRARVSHFPNPAALARCPAEVAAILPEAMTAEAAREIAQWTGFAETPTESLPDLARTCGVAAAHYKDESGRFGLGSFKALGGSYALLQALADKFSLPMSELRDGKRRDMTSAVCAVAATDGNHGRAVAWGAQRFGCRCRIFIHAGVSEGRADAMRRYGAEIVRIEGDYDESLRRAVEESEREGRILISDFSDDPMDLTTRRVMAGYAALSAEARRQMLESPTHVFLPAGVGGLAAAVIADFWNANPESRPRFVIVESEFADCLLQSARRGGRTRIGVREETLMAGLSCGEASAPAWEIVSRGADDFIAIPDDLVAPCMRMAANGSPSLIAGECAVAGWAALLAAANQLELFGKLKLNSQSRVLLIGTEGATDPEAYRRLTGELES